MKYALLALNAMIEDKNIKDHCLYSGLLYVSECNKLGILYNEKVLNTILLHDIGKSSRFDGEGVREKSYEYLKKSPKVYANAIKNMGKGSYIDSNDRVELLVTSVLDYCNSHTDYRGKYCSIDTKLQEVGFIHGMFSEEYKTMLNNIDYYYVVANEIEDTIKELSELLKYVND